MDCVYKVKKENAAFKVIDKEAVFINLDTGYYYALNRVGTDKFNFIHGGCSIGETAEKIAAKYDVAITTVMKDANTLVDDLLREGLLEVEN